jgi:predicted permease
LSPGFTAIAVLSLALGIGANTSIFQLINAIRLKTLPVQNPQELVSIDFEKGATRPGSWYGLGATMTYAQWEQIRTRQQAFAGVMAWSPDRFNLANGGEIRLAEGLYVSGDFFRVLGVGALVGRTFTAQDDTPSCNPGAVLSYAFWQREFGGDPGILQRGVSLDGHSVPIVGVTPPSFFGVVVGNRYDVAVPICADRLLAQDNRSRIPMPAGWWLSAMGRLKPGWTVQSATAYLHALSPSIMQATLPAGYRPDVAKGFLKNKLTAKEAGTGISGLRQQYERPLWLLLATTALVLLIACANLANLLFARATVREREIAVRLAMGASRARLVRQLLVESLLLAIAGAGLGAALAAALSRALVVFISTSNNPLFVDLALDWRMLAFTAGLGVLTCLLFGLLPALRATYMSPASAMRSGGRSATAGRAQFSLRRVLVATQVALSLVLLFGALLFVRSLHNLLTVDAGFKTDGILTVTVDFSKAQYPKARRLAVCRELLDRLSAISGVISVAQTSITPVGGGNWDNLVGADAAPAATSGKEAYFSEPGPGYFRTMGTAMLAGRDFDDSDTPSSPKVAIVNEMFARTFFGGANPVGHTFHMGADAGQAEPVFQIVGLVRNTKYGDLREDFKPIAFFPITQRDPDPTARFVLRIAGQPAQIMSAAKSSIAAMSSAMAIEFHPFSAQLQDSLLRERLMAMLSVGFGFLAGLLATLGLYGVIAYMVAQRRGEIGLRIALGANPRRVIRLILREAILLLGVGLAAGALLALWAGSAASTLLFGLKPHDALSLVMASALLITIALIASYIPARRAAALDPTAALRE